MCLCVISQAPSPVALWEQTEQIPWQTYYSLNRSLAKALEHKTTTLFCFMSPTTNRHAVFFTLKQRSTTALCGEKMQDISQ